MTVSSFERQLNGIDSDLTKAGIPLRYRPLQCFKVIHGVVKDEEREKLFDPIMNWYLSRYGDEARWDGVLGRFPLLVRGRVHLGVATFSAAPETLLSCREHIEDLPDATATSLTENESNAVCEKIVRANTEFRTLYNLTIDDHCLSDFECGLVWRALHDLENAAITLKYTGDTQTATVQAHEAAEKFLKAALSKAGSSENPRKFQHDVPKIFERLMAIEPRYAWLAEPVEHLQKLAPDMQMRYGPTARSIEMAVSAYYAALHICGVLGNAWLFDSARGSSIACFKKGCFYLNGTGFTFYCRRVQGDVAILRLFHSGAFTGSQLIDMGVGVDASAMYLQVTDPAEIAKLKHRLLFHMRNRGKRVSPDQIGLNVVKGSEGAYVTARITRIVRSDE